MARRPTKTVTAAHPAEKTEIQFRTVSFRDAKAVHEMILAELKEYENFDSVEASSSAINIIRSAILDVTTSVSLDPQVLGVRRPDDHLDQGTELPRGIGLILKLIRNGWYPCTPPHTPCPFPPTFTDSINEDSPLASLASFASDILLSHKVGSDFSTKEAGVYVFLEIATRITDRLYPKKFQPMTDDIYVDAIGYLGRRATNLLTSPRMDDPAARITFPELTPEKAALYFNGYGRKGMVESILARLEETGIPTRSDMTAMFVLQVMKGYMAIISSAQDSYRNIRASTESNSDMSPEMINQNGAHLVQHMALMAEMYENILPVVISWGSISRDDEIKFDPTNEWNSYGPEYIGMSRPGAFGFIISNWVQRRSINLGGVIRRDTFDLTKAGIVSWSDKAHRDAMWERVLSVGKEFIGSSRGTSWRPEAQSAEGKPVEDSIPHSKYTPTDRDMPLIMPFGPYAAFTTDRELEKHWPGIMKTCGGTERKDLGPLIIFLPRPLAGTLYSLACGHESISLSGTGCRVGSVISQAVRYASNLQAVIGNKLVQNCAM